MTMWGLIFLALTSLTSALSPIYIKGSKFYTGDGKQFFLKGIAYQLTNDDPLAQGDQCQRDANLMKTLGTNAIRVYHVNPSANHDACMSAFNDAGIYVFLDLDTFDTYILPHAEPPRWNSFQHDAFAAVVDAFHGYDNLGGFFVGNEVLNGGADSPAAPYVKAAARDMKAYRDSKGYRKIPIGYSATDSPELRPNLQNYLACGDNPADAIDFFGLNAYEWCGVSNFQASGYAALQQNASQYNIPIFFSETGCNVPLDQPRSFADQDSILGPDMDNTWSGAIIYEWIQEDNHYGLISYGPPAGNNVGPDIAIGYTRRGTPTPVQPDFNNLSNRWKTLNPTGTPAAAYSPSLGPPPCPQFTSGLWNVDANAALPPLGKVGQVYTPPSPPPTTAAPSSTAIAQSATTAPSGTVSQSGMSSSKTSTTSEMRVLSTSSSSSTTSEMNVSSISSSSSMSSEMKVSSTSSSSSLQTGRTTSSMSMSTTTQPGAAVALNTNTGSSITGLILALAGFFL